MIGRRRARTVLAALATLPLMALLLVGGLDQPAGAAGEFEPKPGSIVTECGPRYVRGDGWGKFCGQTSGDHGRTGYVFSDPTEDVWTEWQPVASKIVIRRELLSTSGEPLGCFIGYPQFRRASDGHIITHGTLVVDTAKGQLLRLGYFDHDEDRFHGHGRAVEPHKYPDDPVSLPC